MRLDPHNRRDGVRRAPARLRRAWPFQSQTRDTLRPNRNSRSPRQNVPRERATEKSCRWPWVRGPRPAEADVRPCRQWPRPPLAQAPMDLVPVANQRKDQQYESNQQQAGSFGSVNGVMATITRLASLVFGDRHADIVAPWRA